MPTIPVDDHPSMYFVLRYDFINTQWQSGKKMHQVAYLKQFILLFSEN